MVWGRIHDRNLTIPNWEISRQCANCHLTGGTNASEVVAIINETGFNASVHRNITGDCNSSNYTAISRVCWGCHNNYTAQAANPKKHFTIKPNCEDCHNSASPQNHGNLNDSLRQTEHQPNGTDITTNITHGIGYSANCTDGHGNDRKSWFIDNTAFLTGIHKILNCTDCHVPLPVDATGSIGAGAAYNRSFTVAGGVKHLNVTLNSGIRSLNLTLGANGTEINSSTAAADPNVDYNESGTTIRYTIKNPATGSWVACISNVSVATSFDLEIEFIRKHPKTGECFANSCESGGCSDGDIRIYIYQSQPDELLNIVSFVPRLSDVFHVTL